MAFQAGGFQTNAFRQKPAGVTALFLDEFPVAAATTLEGRTSESGHTYVRTSGSSTTWYLGDFSGYAGLQRTSAGLGAAEVQAGDLGTYAALDYRFSTFMFSQVAGGQEVGFMLGARVPAGSPAYFGYYVRVDDRTTGVRTWRISTYDAFNGTFGPDLASWAEPFVAQVSKSYVVRHTTTGIVFEANGVEVMNVATTTYAPGGLVIYLAITNPANIGNHEGLLFERFEVSLPTVGAALKKVVGETVQTVAGWLKRLIARGALAATFDGPAGQLLDAGYADPNGNTFTRHTGFAGAAELTGAGRVQGTLNSTGCYLNDDIVGTVDFDLQVDLDCLASTNGANLGGVARAQPGLLTQLRWGYHGGNARWQLVEVASSGAENLLLNLPKSFPAGGSGSGRLTGVGNQLTFTVDGTLVGTATTTITGSGKVGFFIDPNSTPSRTAGYQLAGLSEVLTVGQTLVKVVLEAVEGVEAARRLLGLVRRQAETTQAAEARTTARALVRKTGEAVQGSELARRVRALVRRAADAVSLAEARATLRGLAMVVAETLQAAEARRRVLTLVRRVGEGTQAAEAVRRARTLVRKTAEAVQASETVRRAAVLLRRVAEGVTGSEAVRRLAALVRKTAEGAQLGETRAGVRGLLRAVGDSLQLAETRAQLRVLIQLVTETVRSTELARRLRALARTTTEAVQASETRRRVAALVRQMAAAVHTSEASRRAMTLLRRAQAVLTIGDQADHARGLARVISHGVSITHEALGRAFRLILQVVNDALAVAEARQRARVMVRAQAMSLAVGELATPVRTLIRRAAELVRSSTAGRASRALVRKSAETVRASEALSRLRRLYAVVGEAVRASETVGRLRARLAVLTEGVTLATATATVVTYVEGIIRVVGSAVGIATVGDPLLPLAVRAAGVRVRAAVAGRPLVRAALAGLVKIAPLTRGLLRTRPASKGRVVIRKKPPE